MNKISTLKRALFSSALSCLILFSGLNANGQWTNTCSGLLANTEDFTYGSNGFTGSVNFDYNTTDQIFKVNNTVKNTTYKITSPSYLGTTTTRVGFTLGGDVKLESYSISVFNAKTNQQIGITHTVLLSNNSAAIASNIGSVCFTNTNTAIESNVYFVFSFITRNPAQGGDNAILIFDDFKTNLGEAALLPVNFISFNAKKEGNTNKLTWNVAQQDNVKHYDIERSNDGTSFSKIGEVKASDVISYSFVDAQPVHSSVYYRVKNVDNDGKFKYSTVVSLKNGTSSIVLKAFPLPARNSITVQHNTAAPQAQIRISSQEGRLLKTIRPGVGTMQTSVDLSGLATGLYILNFDNGNGTVETIKLVKQ